MIGRTTLREIREALAAARAGRPAPSPTTPVADELESLARSLKDGPGTKADDPVQPA